MPLSRLEELCGREHPLQVVSSALREYVRSSGAPAVGAYQICCSDESEKENAVSFHEHFVRHLLPELKHFSRSAFRTVTLGGRYERGAIAIAEDHYATPDSEQSFKAMVTKLSSHVAVAGGLTDRVYGRFSRYERSSIACGALHAMLEGVNLPAVHDLAATFSDEDLAVLKRLDRDIPSEVALRAAISSAVRQTALLVEDIVNYQPHSPTLFLVATCVTFNRDGDDTELLVGLTEIDSREAKLAPHYTGLGSDPLAYKLGYDQRCLSVTED